MELSSISTDISKNTCETNINGISLFLGSLGFFFAITTGGFSTYAEIIIVAFAYFINPYIDNEISVYLLNSFREIIELRAGGKFTEADTCIEKMIAAIFQHYENNSINHATYAYLTKAIP